MDKENLMRIFISKPVNGWLSVKFNGDCGADLYTTPEKLKEGLEFTAETIIADLTKALQQEIARVLKQEEKI